MQSISSIHKIIGICLNLIGLFILIFCFFSKNDEVLLYTIIGSLFLGIYSIKTQFQKLYFNNTILMFFLFLYLYGVFLYFVQYILFSKVDSSIYKASIVYSSCFFTFLLGVYTFKKLDYVANYETHLVEPKQGYTYTVLVLLIGLIVFKATFFISKGIFFNPKALITNDRITYFKEISQLEIVLGFLIVGGFLYFIYYYKFVSRNIKIILLVLFLFYALMQLSVGNRRDFTPMIIGFFWVFVCVKKFSFNFYRFLGLLTVILLFLYLGTLRAEATNGQKLSTTEKMAMTLSSNEFVFPFYTLSYEVDKEQKKKNYEFKNGETIFVNTFLNFIPREMYKDKPKSLGALFVEKNFGRGGMGFAYTPVSEFFVNFGYLGPPIIYFLIGMLILKIQNKKDQRLNFLFFVLLIDFCRGEVSTFIYQFLFVAVFLFLPSLGNKLKRY